MKRYSTKEAAEKLGISKNTLLHWLKNRRVPEPRLRDRNNWRLWTEQDLERVIAYRDRTQPSPERSPNPQRSRVREVAHS